MIEVDILDNEISLDDLNLIDSFYESSENFVLEQSIFWIKEIIQPHNHYGIFVAKSGNRIVGLSLVEEFKYERKVSIQFGPLFLNEEVLTQLLCTIKEYYRKKYYFVLHVQLALPVNSYTEYLEILLYKQFKVVFKQNESWGSLIINLNSTYETIFKNFSKAHKSTVKKAVKDGFIVRDAASIDDVNSFSEAFNLMKGKRGLKNDLEYDRKLNIRIYKNISSKKSGYFLVIENSENKLVGGAIFLKQNSILRYYKGVADPNFRQNGILHLAINEGIKRGISENLSTFDLWGYNHYATENEQPYKINVFKKGFGGNFLFYPKPFYIEFFYKSNILHKITVFFTNTLRRILKMTNFLKGFRYKLKYLYWKKFRKIDIIEYASLDELGLDSEKSNYYSFSGFSSIRKAFRHFNITEDDSFIDVGCGKGGTLIALKKFPFKVMGGIEISERLCVCCKENLDKLKIKNFKLYNCGASDFKDFERYNYYYLYNPFPGNVLKDFILNMESSLREKYRKTYIIYKNPEFGKIIEENNVFSLKKIISAMTKHDIIHIYEN